MKVICDRAALVDSLGLVGGVVVARTPKPVLKCVKLAADESGLTLTATDLEVAVRLTSPRIEVHEPGEALVPCDKLTQIVRESVDATLTLETDGEVAHIRGEDSHFQLHGFSPAEFPAVPEFKGEPDFEIPAGDLIMLVNQTAFATARENSRYAINGVLMERDGQKLSIVATDGRRLALAKGACKVRAEAEPDAQARAKEGQSGDVASAIVPTKALSLLQRLLTDGEDNVRVKVADNQILFETDTALLTSTLVEGNFPPYKDVIPRDSDRKAVIATDPFASAVRRAALLTNDESKGVKLSFDQSSLTLSSRAPEMGEAEVRIPVEKFDGEAIDIGFNPQFVLDALKVADTDQVTLEFKAPSKPGVLRTGPHFLYVLMPVNLQS